MRTAFKLIAIFVAANAVAGGVILGLGKSWQSFGGDSVLAGFVIGAVGVFSSIAFLAMIVQVAKRFRQ